MYTVISTAEADAHARAITQWWDTHGQGRRFVDDLALAVSRLSELPYCGAPSRTHPGQRTLLLRRWRVQLYYQLDPAAALVVIRAVWHTSREGAPPL
jgi:plasmid stabilization system protein ParE